MHGEAINGSYICRIDTCFASMNKIQIKVQQIYTYSLSHDKWAKMGHFLKLILSLYTFFGEFVNKQNDNSRVSYEKVSKMHH